MAVLNIDEWDRVTDKMLASCTLGDIVVLACMQKGSREVQETITGELVGYTIARDVDGEKLVHNVAEITIDVIERAGGEAKLLSGALEDVGLDWWIRVIG